jgi:hypothetical protein
VLIASSVRFVRPGAGGESQCRRSKAVQRARLRQRPLGEIVMEGSHRDCNGELSLLFHGQGPADNRHTCSKRCHDLFAAHALKQGSGSPLLKRFIVAFVAFVGLIVPGTFTMAVLAAPPAHPEARHLSDCDRDLADSYAIVASMRVRLKGLNGEDRSQACKATRLYFFEVVRARAVTALCKSGPERERDLRRFDADAAHINDAIAVRCL